MSCCSYCQDEYGIGGSYVGVPVMLGASGVNKILTLDLNEKEAAELKTSADHVKELIKIVEKSS